jgi:hypothetical protein
MHPRYCRGHRLNSDDRLDALLELLPERHLVHLLQQSRHQHLLDEVHQNHLDDLRLGEVRQNRLDDLHLGGLGHLDEVHQNHLDDLRLGDLDHLDERQLDEVLQLRRRLGEVLHYLKRMDCYLLEVVAAQK